MNQNNNRIKYINYPFYIHIINCSSCNGVCVSLFYFPFDVRRCILTCLIVLAYVRVCENTETSSTTTTTTTTTT